MKGMKTYRIGALFALAAIYSPVGAANLWISWSVVLDGSLDQGAFYTLTGSTVIGGNTIHDIFADFFFPNATVGNGTGRAIGTFTITADVVAPEGIFVHDITIFDIGNIVRGVHARNPWYAWTELILDITNPNLPVTLVSESSIEYDLPRSRYYLFTPTRFHRIKQVYTLDGLTYTDPFGNVRIDETAVVSLSWIQKELSLIPEPSFIARIAAGLLSLATIMRRRK